MSVERRVKSRRKRSGNLTRDFFYFYGGVRNLNSFIETLRTITNYSYDKDKISSVDSVTKV